MKQGSLNSVDPPRRPALVILGGVCLLGATVTMIVSLVVGDSRQIGWVVAVLFVAFIVLVQAGKGRKPSPEAVRCSGCGHWLEPAPNNGWIASSWGTGSVPVANVRPAGNGHASHAAAGGVYGAAAPAAGTPSKDSRWWSFRPNLREPEVQIPCAELPECRRERIFFCTENGSSRRRLPLLRIVFRSGIGFGW